MLYIVAGAAIGATIAAACRGSYGSKAIVASIIAAFIIAVLASFVTGS